MRDLDDWTVKRASAYPCPPGFNGKLRIPYLWFSGRPLSGHRYTDATGFRYGTRGLGPDGHANTYQLLPGYKRFLYARLPMMVAPALGIAAYVEPAQTSVMAGGLATLGLKKADDYRRVRRFRKQVVEPVAIGVSAVIRAKHVQGQGYRWVAIPPDFRDQEDPLIRVQLPLSWLAEEGDKRRLVDTVASRLNLEELSPSWHMEAGQYWVDLRVPPKPPKLVTFAEAMEDMETSEATAPLLGYGPSRHQSHVRVTFDLGLDSPHLLIAGGSGAGKSELIAALLGQFMRKGYGVLCFDAKFTSHMWLRKIPQVYYASEPRQLHEGLVWLDQEVMRRARFIAGGGDPATLVPLVAVLEEMNGASNRLRAYWNSIKESGDPQMSPALTALVNISSMGRELMVHILMAGQSLTAKAVGGPENRENFGGRMFARATAAQWKMLAPQIKPAPVKRQGPGRWHLVVGDKVRELQVPFMDLKEKVTPGSEQRLIDWATGGEPIPDILSLMLPVDDDITRVDHSPRPETVSSPGISLPEYARRKGLEVTQLNNWRARRSDFPSDVSTAGRAKLYREEELDAFVANRLREPVSAEEELA